MASKKYCDLCGKEIKKESDGFTVNVFDKDEAVYEADACRSCKARVIKALVFLKK